MADTVLLQVEEHVALVTLNRPEARNALNSEMLARFAAVMHEVEQSGDVDVVILTGAGRAFCAGLDLKEMAAGSGNLSPGSGRPWPPLTKPLIGAINGAAVTGGLELALACDILIASEAARFADTHTRVGLVPFWGLSVLLPQAVGVRTAREMSLTGNFIDAAEAFRCGLVNRVVGADALMATAHAVAGDILSADQPATRKILARYAQFSGGGAAAMANEVRDAEEFLGTDIDLTVIEERRVALMARAKHQG
jgi:enoyl-CoA hydratase